MVYSNNFGQSKVGVRLTPPPPTTIVSNGIILNLDPQTYSGTGTWFGVSPTTLNATLNNGALHSNEINGIMYVDGYNDYISVPYSSQFDFTDGYKDLPMTIMGWCRFSDTGGPIVSKSDIGMAYNNNYSIGISKTGIEFVLYAGNGSSGGGKYFTITSTLQPNTWYQYAVTYTGGTNTSGYQTQFNGEVKIYLNGVLYPYTTGVWGVAFTRIMSFNNPIYLGSQGTDGQWQSKFKGNIGQTMIYNKVLTDSEILQNYSATSTRYAISNFFSKYTGQAAVYSIRKINSSYTGAAMKIRRSSDDTELDIYFDGSGNLNTSSILSFVGSGDGYCSVWYDQSGNVRNMTQTIKSKQLRIVGSGILDTLGDKPCLYKSPGTEGMSSSFGATFSTPNTIFSVMSFSATSSLFSNGTNLSVYNSGGLLRGGAGTELSFTQTSDISQAKLCLFNIDGSSSRLSINNKGIYGNAGTNSINGFTIGGALSGETKWQEVVIYDRPQDWNKREISNSINSYYSLFTSSSQTDLLFTLNPSDTNSYPGSGSDVYDISSENYNGLFYNGASYSSTNNAFLFDGINDYIKTNRTFSLAESSKTLSVWIKPTNNTGGSVIRTGFGNNGELFEIIAGGSGVTGHFWGSGYSFGINAGKTLMNNFTHIAMTYRSRRNGTGGVVTIYVDGVSKGTTNGTLTNGTGELFIASPAYSGTSWFGGYIYDAKLWGKELTASDVLSEYNSTKTRFGL